MSELTNNLANKLLEINTIKGKIREAINKQGGNVSESETFDRYPDAILGLSPSVNLGTLNVSENRSYDASTEGVAGWSHVNVNLSGISGGSGGTGSGTGTGLLDPDGFTQEQTYTVTFYKDTTGDEVFQTVNVEKHGNAELLSNPIKEGGYKFVRWNPRPQDVVNDMECRPVFKIKGAEIEDDWEDIVANGGSDYEVGDFKVLHTGYVNFPEWTPHKSQWKNSDSDTDTIEYVNGNTWPYGVGATNYSVLGYSNKDGTSRPKLYVVMELVAKGEPGTTSTWLARTALQFEPGSKTTNTFVGNKYDINGKFLALAMGSDEWDGSQMQKWLNYELLNAFPEAVRDSIIPVTKYGKGEEESGAPSTSVELEPCKIWIPGYIELKGSNADFDYKSEEYSVTNALLQTYSKNSETGEYEFKTLDGNTRFITRDHSVMNPGYFQSIRWSNGKPGDDNKTKGTSYDSDRQLWILPRIGFCL